MRGFPSYFHAAHQIAAQVKNSFSANRTAPFWNFDRWSYLVSSMKVGSDASRSFHLWWWWWLWLAGLMTQQTEEEGRGGEGSSSPSDNSSWDWRRSIFLFVCDLLPSMKLPVVSCYVWSIQHLQSTKEGSPRNSETNKWGICIWHP